MQQVYRLGSSGPLVAEIRARLAHLGLIDTPAVVADQAGQAPAEVFDADLDRAVRHFQQQRGTSVDGTVGPQTWRLLDEARWSLGDRVLQYVVGHPAAGDDVAALQQRLLDMGFDVGHADGIFGRHTDHALREFQRNVGLPPDGTCGPATFKALDRLNRTVTGGAPHAMREAETIRTRGPALVGKIIVIDPGHGGSDPGHTGHGLTEDAVATDLAARIEGRLVALGVSAYLTRGLLSADDSGPDDTQRAAFANTTRADLLISLHCDGSKDPAASGVATYYYGVAGGGAHSAVGEEFASLMQREIVARTDLLNCRTHGKMWDILRRTRMPAVRLDLGYLSHAGDAARLADPAFRDTVAEAVAVAVQRLYLPPDDDHPTGVLRLPELVG